MSAVFEDVGNLCIAVTIRTGVNEADFDIMVAVPVQLVSAEQGGGAAVRRVGYEPAIAALAAEVLRELETLGAVIEPGDGEDLLPEVGEHGNHVAACAPDLLEDAFLSVCALLCRAGGIIPDHDGIQIEDTRT